MREELEANDGWYIFRNEISEARSGIEHNCALYSYRAPVLLLTNPLGFNKTWRCVRCLLAVPKKVRLRAIFYGHDRYRRNHE